MGRPAGPHRQAREVAILAKWGLGGGGSSLRVALANENEIAPSEGAGG